MKPNENPAVLAGAAGAVSAFLSADVERPKLNPVVAAGAAELVSPALPWGRPKLNPPVAGLESAGFAAATPKLNPDDLGGDAASVGALIASPKLKPVEACVVFSAAAAGPLSVVALEAADVAVAGPKRRSMLARWVS